MAVPPPALSEHERAVLREHGRTWESLEADGNVVIRCLVCRRVSHHPDDLRHLYCGACVRFHEERELALAAEKTPIAPSAANATSAAIPMETLF